MKLATPNDIALSPKCTIDQREDAILNCFLTRISNDLVEGNFTKYINPCGTVEFIISVENVQIDADDVTYRLSVGSTDIYNKIKAAFENNGWPYCFVDWDTKATIVKLYPIMPPWK